MIQVSPSAFHGSGRTIKLGYQIDRQTDSDGQQIINLTVWNAEPRPVRVNSIELFKIDLGAKAEVFRQGFYMPGDEAGFHTLTAGKRPGQDAHYHLAPNTEFEFISHGLTAVKMPRKRNAQLYGFTTGRNYHGFFLFNTKGKSVTLSARLNLEQITLAPGKRIELEQIVLAEGIDLARLLENYADQAGKINNAPIAKKTITGWSDWQFFRNNKTQDDVLESAAQLKKLKDKGFGFEYVIVDAGYCENNSEWLGKCDKFPDGMAQLSKTLQKKYDLKMGVWFAPYVTNVDTEVVKKHPEWLVVDKKGKPISGPVSCVGEYRVLDFTIPEAMEWLRAVVRTMVADWGIKYLKLDGPNPAKYHKGCLADKQTTLIGMFRKTLEVIRAECGPDVLVEGEGIYLPSMGLVDTQRVQQDTWSFWTRPDTGTGGAKQNMKNDLLGAFLHRRVWHNHRENVILRDFPSPNHHMQKYLPGSLEVIMPENERRLQLSAQTLAGGAMLLTDPMAQLLRSKDNEILISKFLPPFERVGCRVGCRAVDVFSGKDAPSIYYLPIERDFEQWVTLGVFNWEDTYQDYTVSLDKIAGPGSFHGFSFWSQEYLGKFAKTIAVKNVPAHGCKVIALRKALRQPQLIGTDMHILQGAVDIDNVSFTGGKLTIKIGHIYQKDRTVTVFVPQRFKFKGLKTNARDVLLDDRKRNLLKINFTGKKHTNMELRFSS